MIEYLEKFKRLIEEKGILTVDEMQRESSELIKKIPNLEEKYKKVIHARGYILEPATTLEVAFNELILKTGGNFVIDPEKKELKIITGIKRENELGSLSFKQKAKLVRQLIENRLNKPEEIPKPSLLDNFERFVAIRDIFAHVPINWFSLGLEFNDRPPYKHFFKLEPKWKDVSVAFNEFMNIQKEMLEVIPHYIKIILLKEKIIASILGVDLKDASKENKFQ